MAIDREELTWMPAWEIRNRVVAGEYSALEVTEHFLARIERLDPVLHAFEELDADGARAQAAALDDKAARGETPGALHGIPTSVKATVRAKGHKHHTFRTGRTPTPSAFDDISVERMRAAGAVVLGTNTMLGAGGGGQSVPDHPGVFTPFNWAAEARSPWDPTRVPGWSSSGGAAAAAARMVPVTIGSDGGGSTRLPAAYSGIVGLHTSRGLIPHVDYEHPTMQLTASYGPLARHVRDVALFTQVIAGPDGRDYVSLQDRTPDCLAHLDDGVAGMKMAWTEDWGFASRYATPDSARIIDVARATARAMTSLGARLDTTEEVWEDRSEYGTVRWTVEPSVYAVQVGTLEGPIQHVDPDLYQAQAESRARNWEKFRTLFDQVDVVLSVTAQRTADTCEQWERNWTVDGPSFPGGSFAPVYCSHTMIFNWLGFPAVSVPCGFVDGLPVGLQIAAWHGREDLVLRAANAFQSAFPQLAHPPIS